MRMAITSHVLNVWKRPSSEFWEVQEAQGRNLAKLVEVLQLQAQSLDRHDQTFERHDRALERIETSLAEMTEKVHFLINREMKRNGGPEAL